MTTNTKIDDNDEIARDGQVVRVPMMLLDSIQRSVAAGTTIIDTAGHRPGSLVMTDADKQKRSALYDSHDATLSGAWKIPPIPISSPTENVGQVVKLNPQAMATRELALASYEQRVASAWKNGATAAG